MNRWNYIAAFKWLGEADFMFNGKLIYTAYCPKFSYCLASCLILTRENIRECMSVFIHENNHGSRFFLTWGWRGLGLGREGSAAEYSGKAPISLETETLTLAKSV